VSGSWAAVVMSVGATHPDAEQSRSERLVGAPQLRPVDRHRPSSGPDRGRTLPVTDPGPGPFAVAVAMPAQKTP
jgi:hypothetical protein